MPLTTKQKSYIDKNRDKLSPKKLAENLKINISEVEDYLTNRPKKKTPFYFYIIMILLPVIFLLLLEGGLRLFGYGKDLDQWITVDDEHYILNPDIAFRYFYNTESIPYSSQDFFKIEKPANTFRVFIIGGSSAAGFPFTPGASFAKYIRKRLELVYPRVNIEVINTAMSAVNSYTLRDLIPGILEQKPDLILMYAGHNEYYGALGVGSMESLGTSRAFVNLMLSLNDFRTVQLVRNFLKWTSSLFAETQQKSGTLMARMARDQLIEYQSDTYIKGVEQFEGNLRDILRMCKDENVPIILGTLTSNLKDQKPFIPGENARGESGDEIYAAAIKEFDNGNYETADSLFRFAKDLDALRFRAPEEMNEVLSKLSAEFDAPLVPVDDMLGFFSPGKIVGDNFMTDHLHPTLKGYQLIGQAYYQMMISKELIPKGDVLPISYQDQDEFVLRNFNFTSLDSTLARYRIIALKSDWPYVDKQIPTYEVLKIFDVRDKKDSLALMVLDNKMQWEKAHRELALYYLERNNVTGFRNEMDVLIDAFPTYTDYLTASSEYLMKYKYFDDALPYLTKLYRKKQDAFSAKWLGIINLSKGKKNEALKFLEESIALNGTDPQTLYNLSGAYFQTGAVRKSLDAIDRCLKINPNFPGAQVFRQEIMQVLQN